jgi:hypothetical protein
LPIPSLWEKIEFFGRCVFLNHFYLSEELLNLALSFLPRICSVFWQSFQLQRSVMAKMIFLSTGLLGPPPALPPGPVLNIELLQLCPAIKNAKLCVLRACLKKFHSWKMLPSQNG